jgi:hypothetical protein
MTRKRPIPLGLQVALGFSAFTALISAVSFGVSLLPSPEEGCIKHCAVIGRDGSMIYVYRWEQTAGMRGRGPMECKCSGVHGSAKNYRPHQD